MRPLSYLIRNITVLNITLSAALAAVVMLVVSPSITHEIKYTLPPGKKTEATNPAVTSPAPPHSPMDYVIVSEQNLFHPDRKIPEEKTAGQAPPPKPEFVLYGTLSTDDLHVAYMEDKRIQPQATTGREKRQIPVKLGDSLSGYTLKEINKDSVLMAKGDEKVTVVLNDSLHPKTRTVTGQAPGTAQQPQVKPQLPAAQPPSAQPPLAVPPTSAASPAQPPVKPPMTPAQSGAVNKFFDFFKQRQQQK